MKQNKNSDLISLQKTRCSSVDWGSVRQFLTISFSDEAIQRFAPHWYEAVTQIFLARMDIEFSFFFLNFAAKLVIIFSIQQTKS